VLTAIFVVIMITLVVVPLFFSVLLMVIPRAVRLVLVNALNDLIEFTSIKPYAATARTIVDLNTITIAHNKWNLADRTIHNNNFSRVNYHFNLIS
jgi:hypothetical protein